jgi:hypothetical protein
MLGKSNLINSLITGNRVNIKYYGSGVITAGQFGGMSQCPFLSLFSKHFFKILFGNIHYLPNILRLKFLTTKFGLQITLLIKIYRSYERRGGKITQKTFHAKSI